MQALYKLKATYAEPPMSFPESSPATDLTGCSCFFPVVILFVVSIAMNVDLIQLLLLLVLSRITENQLSVSLLREQKLSLPIFPKSHFGSALYFLLTIECNTIVLNLQLEQHSNRPNWITASISLNGAAFCSAVCTTASLG